MGYNNSHCLHILGVDVGIVYYYGQQALKKNSNFQAMSLYGLDIYYNVVTVGTNQDYLIIHPIVN